MSNVAESFKKEGKHYRLVEYNNKSLPMNKTQGMSNTNSDEFKTQFKDFHLKFFADSGDLKALNHYLTNPFFSGITTNPSLLKQAGATCYADFAKLLLKRSGHLPVSFGTTSDEPKEIIEQALTIQSWSPHIYVKVPIINARGEPLEPVIKTLVAEGVQVNVTAIMNEAQAERAISCFRAESKAYLSVFAGRISDTGRCPQALFKKIKMLTVCMPQVLSLWASVREVYNIFQAEACGADIITLNDAIIKKLPLVGMDLETLSQKTVAMFHQDAKDIGHFERCVAVDVS